MFMKHAGALLFAATIASAAPVTFTFGSDPGPRSTNTNSGSGHNNTRTFTSGGVTVTVTGWGRTVNTANVDLERGQLGLFSSGLGVCDVDEGTGCSSPQHQVDNSSRLNFVLFSFTTPVDPTEIIVRTFGDGYEPDSCDSTPSGPGNSPDCSDTDISYWLRTTSSAFSLAGLELSEIESIAGFGPRTDQQGAFVAPPNAPVYNNVTHAIGGAQSVYHLLVAAQVNGTSDGKDFFKIYSLTIDEPPSNDEVPEPATLGLIGGTLLGLGLLRRKS